MRGNESCIANAPKEMSGAIYHYDNIPVEAEKCAPFSSFFLFHSFYPVREVNVFHVVLKLFLFLNTSSPNEGSN